MQGKRQEHPKGASMHFRVVGLWPILTYQVSREDKFQQDKHIYRRFLEKNSP
jgi:hypothetical protein